MRESVMENQVPPVLVVEDSSFFARAIVKKIKKQLALECVVASTFAQDRKLVEDR